MESPSLQQALNTAKEAVISGTVNGLTAMFGVANQPAQQPPVAPTASTAAPGVPASAPNGAGSGGAPESPNGMDTQTMLMYGAIAVLAIAGVIYVMRRG